MTSVVMRPKSRAEKSGLSLTVPKKRVFSGVGGGGGAGRILFTWTDPPQIAWQGWIADGETWTAPDEFASTQLQAHYPRTPPADAPPEPEGGADRSQVLTNPSVARRRAES